MQQKKRILVCPLDWGLGHATRCIPIIHSALQKNATVLIAGSGRSLELLKMEFPELEVINLPGYDVQYSKGLFFVKMVFSIPKILRGIRREHATLHEIIRTHQIDIVISDNRYGLWSNQAKTVFITHQLFIKTSIGARLLRRINFNYIRRFTACWIPDQEGANNLSGDLSHAATLPTNAVYIGSLSRFNTRLTSPQGAIVLKNRYDLLVVISGPEPQRSIFEKLILKQLQPSGLSALVVRGMSEIKQQMDIRNTVDLVSHLNAAEMKQAFLSSSLIIARSGYSTIMDLAALGKKAIFIPTPGQTEQEYLAKHFMLKKVAYSQPQHVFNLLQAIEESKQYSGFSYTAESGLEKQLEFILTTP